MCFTPVLLIVLKYWLNMCLTNIKHILNTCKYVLNMCGPKHVLTCVYIFAVYFAIKHKQEVLRTYSNPVSKE